MLWALIGLVEERTLRLLAVQLDLVGHVAEVEVPEDAIKLGEMSATRVLPRINSMFSSFWVSELSEKLADPVQTRGSSDSGSMSRNLVCTKKMLPTLRECSSSWNH